MASAGTAPRDPLRLEMQSSKRPACCGVGGIVSARASIASSAPTGTSRPPLYRRVAGSRPYRGGGRARARGQPSRPSGSARGDAISRAPRRSADHHRAPSRRADRLPTVGAPGSRSRSRRLVARDVRRACPAAPPDRVCSVRPQRPCCRGSTAPTRHSRSTNTSRATTKAGGCPRKRIRPDADTRRATRSRIAAAQSRPRSSVGDVQAAGRDWSPAGRPQRGAGVVLAEHAPGHLAVTGRGST